MKFSLFKNSVESQIKKMLADNTKPFKVAVSKDTLWDTYISSFPQGSNEIYKENTEFDCHYCRDFIKNIGGLVTIENHKLISIWDINVGGPFQSVADAMSKLIKATKIENIFLSPEPCFGKDFNDQLKENGKVIRWEHFFFDIPADYFMSDSTSLLGAIKSKKDVYTRGLEELTLDAAKIVQELIDTNVLPRGAEYKDAVDNFIKHKKVFDQIETTQEKDIFTWASFKHNAIRNTAIGALLIDISEGKDLDQAVAAYDSIVAPTNYKRTTAIVSPKMINELEKKLDAAGLKDSLYRRFATALDLNINNLIFSAKKSCAQGSVFDELRSEAPVKARDYSKVENICIEDFISNVVPQITSMEVMFTNEHENKLMSLTAPQFPESTSLFKWTNKYGWSYNGDVTDSITAKVKKAGGNIDAVLRYSGAWFNYDDLDIHASEPNGVYIAYPNKQTVHPSSGILDVDMNAGGGQTREPVENIVWTDRNRMPAGDYDFFIHGFEIRESTNVGFNAEVAFDGRIFTFNYNKAVRDEEKIHVARVNYSHTEGFKITKSLPYENRTKQIWGITSNKFQEVDFFMLSPNYWSENNEGNKHFFFILKNCVNPQPTRGFFNEYLRTDLHEHRKAFEVLGNKLRMKSSQNQLSGLGFSSTLRNELICRVKGNLNRTLNIKF